MSVSAKTRDRMAQLGKRLDSIPKPERYTCEELLEASVRVLLRLHLCGVSLFDGSAEGGDIKKLLIAKAVKTCEAHIKENPSNLIGREIPDDLGFLDRLYEDEMKNAISGGC